MRFRILGPLEVYDSHGALVSVCAPKQRALLAVLLLDANEPVSLGRIEAALWPGDPPRSAGGLIRTYVCGLRDILQDSGTSSLVKEPAGYRLRVPPDELDLAVFNKLSVQARRALDRGDAPQAARLLSRALALWRGEPELPQDIASGAALAELMERRLIAEEAWTDAQLTLGNASDLVGRLRCLALQQPIREHIHGQLMRALHMSGRKAEALAEFRALRTRMTAELGIEPSAAMQDLHRRILADDATLAYAPAPQPTPRELPHDIGHFTGRNAQLATMTAALLRKGARSAGIAVITGNAGAGKTALAVHFAHRVAHRFSDGQLYADLRGHAVAARLPPDKALNRFLRAFGVSDIPGDLDEAAAMFRSLTAGKRVLILLDNASTVSQVRPLLPGSPHCLVLVTSREQLAGLVARDGGIGVSVGPLDRSEGVSLLRKILGEQRVAAEPEAAAALAARWGFLPLALRLAAERARNRPWPALTEIADELADEERRLNAAYMNLPIRPADHGPARPRTGQAPVDHAAWSSSAG